MIGKSYVINRQLTSLILSRNNSWKLSNSRKGLGLSFLVVLDELIGLDRWDQESRITHFNTQNPTYFHREMRNHGYLLMLSLFHQVQLRT